MMQPTWKENGAFSDAACTMGKSSTGDLPILAVDEERFQLIVFLSEEAL